MKSSMAFLIYSRLVIESAENNTSESLSKTS